MKNVINLSIGKLTIHIDQRLVVHVYDPDNKRNPRGRLEMNQVVFWAELNQADGGYHCGWTFGTDFSKDKGTSLDSVFIKSEVLIWSAEIGEFKPQPFGLIR